MNISGKKFGSRAETRARLLGIFNRLLLEGNAPRPRVSAIIAEAGVSRSTFYDHFDGVEALAMESLSQLFGALSNCLVGDGEREQLVSLIAHVGENRTLARELLTGERAERSEALLARILEEHLPASADRRLHAIIIAGTVVSGLAGWVTGRLDTSAEELASTLASAANAILYGG